jgi:hypothetical protein
MQTDKPDNTDRRARRMAIYPLKMRGNSPSFGWFQRARILTDKESVRAMESVESRSILEVEVEVAKGRASS